MRDSDLSATPHLSRLYADRADAGRRLADILAPLREQAPLILAIPRGGVPVAAEVARRLEGNLDIVVARKLGAPGRPELAIGAVTTDGSRVLNDEIIAALRVTDTYLAAITAAEQAEAQRRETDLRAGLASRPIQGRTVIIVDDGLATGATMRAAVRSVRQRRPARLMVAVPVGSTSACQAVRAEVDVVICPRRPEPFWAVGAYYAAFEPVEDDQVRRLLRDMANRRRPTDDPLPAPADGPEAEPMAPAEMLLHRR
jgi:predicted phosphoribosyltransferase